MESYINDKHRVVTCETLLIGIPIKWLKRLNK